MELFKQKSECCGCSACASICTSKAIRMERDKHGFLYPEIEKEKCIDCGQCRKICPISNQAESAGTGQPVAFAVKNRDETIRNKSTSGGVFYELAVSVLEKGGTVYGAVFDENFQVVHFRGECLSDIYKMQGSKYVQSNMNGIFESVRKDLINKKTVLFTGCPCQVDALKHYLKDAEQSSFITCDLICRGVNSPKAWNDYLKYTTKNEKILEVRFRDKSLGWRTPQMYIQTAKVTYMESSSYDCFFQAFFSSLILRDSCFACKYCNVHRYGDITIGDFWGIEKIDSEMNDDRGISLVLLNSYKGKEFFEKILDKFYVKEVEINDVEQPSLKKPEEYPVNYNKFWTDYSKKGIGYVCKKYFNGGVKGTIKRKVKMILIRFRIWEKLGRS